MASAVTTGSEYWRLVFARSCTYAEVSQPEYLLPPEKQSSRTKTTSAGCQDRKGKHHPAVT